MLEAVTNQKSCRNEDGLEVGFYGFSIFLAKQKMKKQVSTSEVGLKRHQIWG